jgi:hypothetical protein
MEWGDGDVILNIRLPSKPIDDFLAWHYAKGGVFSVRSAYKSGKRTCWRRTKHKGQGATIFSSFPSASMASHSHPRVKFFLLQTIIWSKILWANYIKKPYIWRSQIHTRASEDKSLQILSSEMGPNEFLSYSSRSRYSMLCSNAV